MKKIGVVKKKISGRELRLKIMLLKAGLNLKDVGRVTQYSNHMVCKYIKGTRNSKRLDEFFEELRIKLRGNKNANLSGS